MESNSIITFMLVLLCTLAALDLWRQMAIRDDNFWFEHYTKAVQQNYDYWKMGFRLEDLELKIESQKERWSLIKRSIELLAPNYITKNTLRHGMHTLSITRQARITMHNLMMNDTEMFQIRCESGGQLLRVGLDDFRTDSRDVCQVFTSVSKGSTGPHTLFDLVPLKEGAFALRSVGSGLFIKAVPPPPENELSPWKLVVGGALIGIAETFRLTQDNYLFSPLVGGFFTCASGQMVAASPGKYGSFNHFILEKPTEDEIKNAYKLIDLSHQISNIQTKYIEKHTQSQHTRKENVNNILSSDSGTIVKICIGVPITSKGTDMPSILDSPFWSNLFDSFMKSIDWRSNRYIFRFYIGFDKADSLYDTGDAWSDFRDEFKHRATYRMTEQMMDEPSINSVLDKQLSVKLMHFDHLEGAPSQVVSQLMLAAYIDQFDYFYQVNDDTIIVSPNWAPKLISALASNPTIPNLGVTGPSDSNNEKIFTHSFVHRTHFDVFGHLFPPAFKNWWSDDWITTVYGSEHTFRVPEVTIKHNIGAQKTSGTQRYQVDQGAQLILGDELRKGHVQIDEWLKKNSYPRLILPNICGYIPLVSYIAKEVESKKEMKKVQLLPEGVNEQY